MSKAINNMLAPDSASRQAADSAGSLTRLRAGAFLEAKSGTVRFEEIKSAALAMVVKFMVYKRKLADRRARRQARQPSVGTLLRNAPRSSPTDPVPEFKIPPELALELLVAADYLDL